jgi:hypothetical protein
MQYFWNAFYGAFWFAAPCAAAAIMLALLISGLCYALRTAAERDEKNPDSFVSFSAIARLTVAFALFGYTLGIFTGMAGQSLAGTIIGTISTTAATYLAYLYAKDTPANSRLPVVSALSAFFIVVPFAVQYQSHYAA